MASEVTQRQRAEANDLYNHLISPMWKGTAPDAARERIFLALQHARQEALREACKLVNDYNCMHNHGKKATKACDDILEQLDRLAREGVKG